MIRRLELCQEIMGGWTRIRIVRAVELSVSQDATSDGSAVIRGKAPYDAHLHMRITVLLACLKLLARRPGAHPLFHSGCCSTCPSAP